MTANHAAGGEPETARHPKAFDRLDPVARTARMETATRRQPAADTALVCANQKDQQGGHCRLTRVQIERRSAWISLFLAFPACGFASSTTSQGGRAACSVRKLSRARRLTRLRSTALGRALRAIARPRRGCPASLPVTTAIKLVDRSLRPCSKTRLNCAGLSRRARRVKRATLSSAALGNQASTALGPTTGQHLATADGCHAGTETVRALAPQGMRLESAFHGGSLETDKKGAEFSPVAPVDSSRQTCG